MKSFLTSLPSHIASGVRRVWSYAMAHKIIAGVAAVVVLFGGYKLYAAHQASVTTTQYVLARASNQPIESTVTASGEVAASHQLDLAPKASGQVTGVYVKAGDTVSAGQLVATIDATDAQKTVRDAQLSLQSAQISYTQAITSANTSITNSQTSVGTQSESAFDAVTAAESNFQTVTHGIDTLLHAKSDVPSYQSNEAANAYVRVIDQDAPQAESVRETAQSSYEAAIDSYNETFSAFQAASRSSSPEDIQNLVTRVQDTAAKIAQAAKDTQAFLSLVNTTTQQHDLLAQPPSIGTQVTTAASYVSTISSTANSLASAQSSLTSAIQSYSSNTQSISGGMPLSIQSAELTLAKAKESLADAQTALADYTVRAPFAGTIAAVDVQKFDQSGTKVATLITTEQYADISLNESDIASIRAGQKATLTFDAIEGLTIDGTVAQVNQVGTVSQGVTTYDVKVGFDTQDDRVKPGMTVNATIVTASKDSALVVPSSAVKNQNGEYYIEVATMTGSSTPKMNGTGAGFTAGFGSSTERRPRMASSTAGFGIGTSTQFAGRTLNLTVSTTAVTVRRVPVTIGIQSDTMTEITSGLTPGELVVSQSLNASGATTSSSKGLFGLFGGSGTRTPAGSATRITTGSKTTGTAPRAAGNATFIGPGG